MNRWVGTAILAGTLAAPLEAQQDSISKKAVVYFDKSIPDSLRAAAYKAIEHLKKPEYGLHFTIIDSVRTNTISTSLNGYPTDSAMIAAFPEVKNDSIEVIVFAPSPFTDTEKVPPPCTSPNAPPTYTERRSVGYRSVGIPSALFIALRDVDLKNVESLASTIAHEFGHRFLHKDFIHSSVPSVMYPREVNDARQTRGFTPAERARVFMQLEVDYTPPARVTSTCGYSPAEDEANKKATPLYIEANDLFAQGKYDRALHKMNAALALRPGKLLGTEILLGKTYIERQQARFALPRKESPNPAYRRTGQPR
jgi:hypothetical protein